jgi:hypothetical protein
MRTRLIPILLVTATTLLFSCQKELTGDIPGTTTTGTDSAWYVNSIHSKEYDSTGALIDSVAEYYTYQDSKTLYKNIEYDITNATTDSFQYTYSYDQNKRVTKFAYDYNTNLYDDVVKSILFSYPNNTSALADIIWGNNDVQRDYISYTNGNKVMTVYDTVPRYAWGHDIFTSYLGTDNRADSFIDVSIDYTTAGTYIDRAWMTYDAQGNLASYYEIYPDLTPEDSLVVLSRETRGAEISNTFDKILSNMRWYPLLLDNGFWALDYSVIYLHHPMISAKRWSRDINSQLTIYDTPVLFNGTFGNTFDSNNLLVQQEIPKGFANKYGGTASLQFTYIKLPK